MASLFRSSVVRVSRPLRQFHTAAPVASHIGRTQLSYGQDVTITHDATPITTPRISSERDNTMLTVTGPLGTLKMPIKPFVKLQFTSSTGEDAENILQVSVEDETIKQQRAMWGTTRNLINNMIVGVSEGYRMQLRLVGVGYRGVLENDRTLSLKLGYSHPVVIPIPEGITCTVPQPNRVLLQSSDLQKVTQLAATIQSWRKPEPYNQKGIFINDETIKKKEGKKK
ncbi:ribosomal protein L6, alpha-beta domain-containing protein [Radiomyces spectabilis]|uniref:ribosomal protein L6, alpha-beta domain-containing protein n=1 Tax=Radiomyces spectabilis TaxID=64574 RepID=UPI002220D7B5|nr:ribosomal protein L6, alpha-beta domain-containing protein [Radiomyces spectabilis]KAI8393827.1 ribosomal protein L6, alpha-beta domain-containing protein [Radiomyces spectabilis]